MKNISDTLERTVVAFWFAFCLILTNWYVVILEEGFREAKINVKHIFENQDCILNLSRRQVMTIMNHIRSEENDEKKTRKTTNKKKSVTNINKRRTAYVRKFR